MKDKEQLRKEEAERKVQSDTEQARLMDPGKAGVLGCDGYFEPENRQPHGAMRPGKTYEDHLPVERRNRVQAANRRGSRS